MTVCITTKLRGSKYTGLFERYIPSTDSWEVLPDPPSFHLWVGAELLDCATVIGSRVIIGCPEFHGIFDLEKLIWDDALLQQPAPSFPFCSVFVQQRKSAYLYLLSGPHVPRLPNRRFSDSPFNFRTAVMRFPLPVPIASVDNSKLVDYPASVSCNKQTMAQSRDLNHNIPFTKNYYPMRFFFHVGGHFFCYVVTAQLCDQFDHAQWEPCSRAVVIKFFKDVSDDNSTNNNDNRETKFQPVASFCYKFNTKFVNMSYGTRCSVIGTVPDSWINSPPKKKQESFAMRTEREKSEVGPQTSCLELEKAVNDQPYETWDLEKLKAEISSLEAELAAFGF